LQKHQEETSNPWRKEKEKVQRGEPWKMRTEREKERVK